MMRLGTDTCQDGLGVPSPIGAGAVFAPARAFSDLAESEGFPCASNRDSPWGLVWRPARRAKPLSSDLRLRIIRAVEVEGMSCRGAAGRFGVAPSTAIELVNEWRSTGACKAGVQGGDRR